MITIPTTFSNGRFDLQTPIPGNALRVLYGATQTTVFQPGDVLPTIPDLGQSADREVVVNARPGVDCTDQVKALLQQIKPYGGTLVFPRIGGVGYYLSDKILIDFDHCTIILEDNVKYTGTTAISAVFHFRGSISPAKYLESPALIATRKITIDANGRNLIGYVHPAPGAGGTIMFGVWFQFCRNIKAENFYVYNGIAGGLIGSYCLGGSIDKIDVSDVRYDNGIYFYNNGEHYGLPQETNPGTWCNVTASNCRSWNCANHGMGIFGAIGVTYNNPKIWNCGNNSILGDDGQPRLAGPAGGLGIEFDLNTDPNALLDYKFTATNVQVTGSYGYAIRTNCKGTVIKGGFVKGSKIPTNWTDPAPFIWGTDIFVQYAATADIEIETEGSEQFGLRIQGGAGKFPKVKFNGRIKGAASRAVLAIGFERLNITSSSEFENNLGSAVIELNNSPANADAGYAKISGRFDNNGGSVLSANRIGHLDTSSIKGHNNCAALGASFHCIYIPSVQYLKSSDIMLTSTNGLQSRVLKCDSSLKAVLDRNSILGDQTSTSAPRADVVSTTLIADIFAVVPPAAAPSYHGQRWTDTNLNKVYMAKAVSAVGDWILLN